MPCWKASRGPTAPSSRPTASCSSTSWAPRAQVCWGTGGAGVGWKSQPGRESAALFFAFCACTCLSAEELATPVLAVGGCPAAWRNSHLRALPAECLALPDPRTGQLSPSNPYNVGALENVAFNNLRCTWVPAPAVTPSPAPKPKPVEGPAPGGNVTAAPAKDLQVWLSCAGAAWPWQLCCMHENAPEWLPRGALRIELKLLSNLPCRCAPASLPFLAGGVHSHRVCGAGDRGHIHSVPGQVRSIQRAGGQPRP